MIEERLGGRELHKKARDATVVAISVALVSCGCDGLADLSLFRMSMRVNAPFHSFK